jgi:hypothetical protein
MRIDARVHVVWVDGGEPHDLVRESEEVTV